jgi:hypothetical protein
MSLAGRAQIAAYGVACLIAGASALAASEPGRVREATWREAIERAEAALAGGNPREARRHWEGAYRVAVHARTPEGLLAVGRAYLSIGEATRGRQSAVSEARRIFLIALFQARERGDADGVALAGEAFAALGDREVADRAFDVAIALATRNRDAASQSAYGWRPLQSPAFSNADAAR